jgi:release factor glutamine methyltransferase
LFVTDEDPLIFYRAILDNASYILNPGGKIYFEINEALGKQILTLMASHNLHKINIIKDLNGKDRIARGEKR